MSITAGRFRIKEWAALAGLAKKNKFSGMTFFYEFLRVTKLGNPGRGVEI